MSVKGQQRLQFHLGNGKKASRKLMERAIRVDHQCPFSPILVTFSPLLNMILP